MRHVLVVVVVAIAIAGQIGFSAAASDGLALKGAAKGDAQKQLEGFLLNKQLVAKVKFPACNSGIELNTDGTWDVEWTTRSIKDHGVGLGIGDKASVTNVKLRDDLIEVHLNGGGAVALGDKLLVSKVKKALREGSGGRAPGGSRLNLRFGRNITDEDIKNLDELVAYLDPLVDASSLRQAAKRAAFPEQFKEAAAKGEVLVGMDKVTVFAIMGEPKSKNVDMSGEPPIEKWQFDLQNLKTRIVTFKEGKVSGVDEF